MVGYYPFGMLMPGRKYEAGSIYRYGFNGQERSQEIDGAGSSYTAEFWQYDARLGRRWNVDPVYKENESPYATFGNNPIWNIDPDGADTIKYISNAQLVSAIKIASNEVKNTLKSKQSLTAMSDATLKSLRLAVDAYAEKNNLTFAQYAEFDESVQQYYRGLAFLAFGSGAAEFEKLDRAVINNKKVNNYLTIKLTIGRIRESEAYTWKVLTMGIQAVWFVSTGGVGSRAGPGPRVVQTPTVTKSADFGRIIGWGEGQTAAAAQTTREITKNLTRAQVQAFKNQGLTKQWVEAQLKMYNKAVLDANKASKNVNLAPRKELMEKILYLWEKK